MDGFTESSSNTDSDWEKSNTVLELVYCTGQVATKTAVNNDAQFVKVILLHAASPVCCKFTLDTAAPSW